MQADSFHFQRRFCTKTFFWNWVNIVFAIDVHTSLLINSTDKYTQLTSFYGPRLFLSLSLVQKGSTVWWPNIFLFRNLVWSCLIKFERQTFDQTMWNILFVKTCLVPFGHSVQCWSPSNVSSCLVTKHFLFGQGFLQLVFSILSAVEPRVIQIMWELYEQSGNWEQAA